MTLPTFTKEEAEAVRQAMLYALSRLPKPIDDKVFIVLLKLRRIAECALED